MSPDGHTSDEEGRPLTGLRVVELGTWIAAPFAATLLGDFGAEVIKVESTDGMDMTRRPRTHSEESATRSGRFAALARNKRGMVLDPNSEAGRLALRRIVEDADVLVSNLSSRQLQLWGLDPVHVMETLPRLIVLIVSAYGLTGPRHEEVAVDPIAQAFGGLHYVTGDAATPPVAAGLNVADYLAGWVGAFGVLVALRERDRSGLGQVVDLGLYEPLLPMLQEAAIAFHQKGVVQERRGSKSGNAAAGVFECKDGSWVRIASSSESLYHRLMTAIGREDLANRPDLQTALGREACRAELQDVITSWVHGLDAHEVDRRLGRARVPCAVVNSVADVLNDPQVRARQNVRMFEDEELGYLPVINPLPRLTRTPGHITALGPKFGEDTRAVLREVAALSEAEVGALVNEGTSEER